MTLPPYRIETQLRTAEMRYLRLMQQCIKAELPAIYAAYRAEREQNLRLDSLSDFQETVRRAFSKAKKRFRERIEDDEYEEPIKKVSRNALAFFLFLWGQMARERLGKAIRKDYFQGPAYDAMANSWSVQSAEKAKEVVEDFLQKTERVVLKDYTGGKNIKELIKDVQHRYDVAKSRITNTAGDQTGTLHAKITEMQMQSAGVDEYVWSTSKDERVRPCHAEFEGRTFRSSEPPEIWYMTKHGKVYTGRHCNPGEDYNCRCVKLLPKAVESFNASAFK